MARNVRLVIVCEDILHRVFLTKFLYQRGFTPHQLTFRTAPAGVGDAKRYVCDALCVELKALRKFRRNAHGLVYVVDADNLSVAERLHCMELACSSAGVDPPKSDEPVFGVIPKWEIENWLAYLRVGEVDESVNNYDKYRGCESDIAPLVKALADKCAQHEQLSKVPPSLEEACGVCRRFEEWKRTSASS
ncbi:MAG TPA: hypothetical protein VFJ58_28265 [Armatimonadota bacterium]|nr:hypothetical protein [Armatimonadota bacterium]